MKSPARGGACRACEAEAYFFFSSSFLSASSFLASAWPSSRRRRLLVLGFLGVGVGLRASSFLASASAFSLGLLRRPRRPWPSAFFSSASALALAFFSSAAAFLLGVGLLVGLAFFLSSASALAFGLLSRRPLASPSSSSSALALASAFVASALASGLLPRRPWPWRRPSSFVGLGLRRLASRRRPWPSARRFGGFAVGSAGFVDLGACPLSTMSPLIFVVGGVTDAVDLLDVLERLERAVLLAVVDDGLRLHRADAVEGFELFLGGRIDVDGGERHAGIGQQRREKQCDSRFM